MHNNYDYIQSEKYQFVANVFCDKKSNKAKNNEIPLRKSLCKTKAKTNKMKDYLKKKSEKERRKAVKENHRIKTKQYIAETVDKLDEAISEAIEKEYLKDLEAEDREYFLQLPINLCKDNCDCCNKNFLDQVEFYEGCEQFLCKGCLLNEK